MKCPFKPPISHPFWRASRRCVDIALSCILGILFLPLMILIALAIRFESSGSILYQHKRVGYGGTTFSIYKFRTMVDHADTMLNTVISTSQQKKEWEENHKLRYDPRITKLGLFLRKYSLDELPQLFNILRGDMSLIGPRPIVQEEIPKYGTYFSDYVQVRPGLTGLWQVSGRNTTSYETRVALDRYYVRNWSPCLDTWILIKTIPVVLSGKGAW